MNRLLPLAALATTVLLSGCHTPVVDATIINSTGATIRVMEMDYPNASFGTSKLAPGASFHYRFVIQDPGRVSISYSDLHGQDHKATGPAVDKGERGTVLAVLRPSGVDWTPHLSAMR